MFYFNQQPGRTVISEGEEYLFFSGYSYLGMSYVKEFTDLIKEGIDKYGLVFPSSRISNTRLPLYKLFEEKLAELTGMEECISFSSGYMSGKTISTVLSSHPHLFVSPNAHPAVTPERIMQTNLSLKEWEEQLLNFCIKEKPFEIAIITDSINTAFGKVNDFLFLTQIPSAVKIICLVDDSHGIGLLGQNGEGIISQLPGQSNIEYIITCSLSKAFHVEGGVICCSSLWANKIRQQHFYTGSTAILPSLAHTFINAGEFYENQRIKLFQNIKSLALKIKDIHYVNHYGLPIFALHSSLTEDVFKKDKIIISSFGYPDPDYDKNNRVVVNALHTETDLEKLANSIREKT
jgi:8-amino-7-oxononanoate synthase